LTSLSRKEAAKFGVKRRHSTGKRTGAIVYGLCLTVGVLIILRPELVEKFGLPLLYTTKAQVEYTVDDGVKWQNAEAVVGQEDTFAVPVQAGATVALRARDPKAPLRGLEETNVTLEYSSDKGAKWAKCDRTKAGAIDCQAFPAGLGASPILVRVMQEAPKAAAEAAAAGAVSSAGSQTNAGGTAASATSLDAAIAKAWLMALLPVIPVGLFIAWVVLQLGYLKNGATTATLIFFTLFGLTMIVPFLWMVSTAFKTQEATDIYKIQWLAWPIRWANFYDVFSRVPFARFYLNTVFLASYVTLGSVFTSSLAAYSFARLEFPGRDKIFMAYLATMMIPGAVTSIPVFVLMCKIGWVDSYKAIIIPSMFSAYGTFMLRQFFMTLPRDLEDAAKIDGCSLFGIFWRIIVPLSKPAVATLTIFTFMGEWNDFMWPLIILNDPNKMPLQVGLQFFRSAETPDTNVLMCASMLMIVPVIIVFLLGQRYFVEGIQLGAVKG
jgi:multiple sugar transport system permease protein